MFSNKDYDDTIQNSGTYLPPRPYTSPPLPTAGNFNTDGSFSPPATNTLTYARIDAITRRLSGRITIINLVDQGITGVTGTQIGTDLIYLIGQGIEEFLDMYLSMVYFMPLQYPHTFLANIAEKMICGEVYNTLFPSSGENPDQQDSYSSLLRSQALNEFQTLFDGLGIFVPGASSKGSELQNDENKQQMAVKAVFLLGESVKPYIGHDYNGDNLSDSDLFKTNANVEPSFYTEGDEQLRENSGLDVVDGVRIRPRYSYNRNPYREDISFW